MGTSGMSVFNSILNILRFNRRNWKAVVLCIFAATIFWFFNALNKTYTTNINFPLRFDFDRAHYVPVKSLPNQVRINVTGNGWDLFKRSIGVKAAALEIPLERPSEVKKIVGSTTLLRFFSNQVDGLEINFVLTDTLYLDLEPKVGRWIKLALDSVEQNLRKGFGIASDISIMPDSIFIEGPQRLIKQFQEPVKIRLSHRNIDEAYMEEVDINVSNAIKREPSSVAVMFDVQKMTLIQDSLKIDIENVPPTISYVEERKIPVTLAVPEKMLKRFTLDSARAVLNLRNFTRGEAKILPRAVGLPRFTQVVKIDTIVIRL